MTIIGKVGSVSYGLGRARSEGMWPAVCAVLLKVDQGELPAGLILSDSSAGMVPYEAVADEAVGTGDGTEKNFTHTLAKAPAMPGSVEITDGVETFTDDGLGRLAGSAGGTGTVVYATGAVAVGFNAAPANAAAITADYQREPAAVLDEPVDTAESGSGLVIRMGPVQNEMLKVGAVTPASPSDTLLAALVSRHIYPV